MHRDAFLWCHFSNQRKGRRRRIRSEGPIGRRRMAGSKKIAAWRDYQEMAADLFRQMGFAVAIEETLEGARGKHEIDVVARTSLGGVATLWIVGCKHWKTSIPKAQALKLAQIAQDVGGNHAFLLAAQGCQ